MPVTNKTVWITREGRAIEIRHMASSHLLAAIHFIERNRYTQAVEFAMREQAEPDILMNDPTFQYYTMWPEAYEALINEAQRRNLIYRGIEKSNQLVVRKKE